MDRTLTGRVLRGYTSFLLVRVKSHLYSPQALPKLGFALLLKGENERRSDPLRSSGIVFVEKPPFEQIYALIVQPSGL